MRSFYLGEVTLFIFNWIHLNYTKINTILINISHSLSMQYPTNIGSFLLSTFFFLLFGYPSRNCYLFPSLVFWKTSIDPLFREVLLCLWVFYIARFKDIYTSWSLNAISMKLESQLTWVAKLEIGFSVALFNFESPRHSFPCWQFFLLHKLLKMNLLNHVCFTKFFLKN